jgi:excisionase family DNA binding protein
VDDVVTYLTPSQVGDLLQVSTKSVLRWALADASMPVLKIGGTVRFPKERLLRWLRDQEQGRPAVRQRTSSPMLTPAVAGD